MGGDLDDAGAEAGGLAEGHGFLKGADAGGAGIEDEGFGAERGEGDALPGGERMTGGKDGDEGLGEEGFHVEMVLRVGIAEETDVEGAIVEAFEDAGGEGLLQLEVDLREALANGAEEGWETGEHGGADEADVERAELAGGDLAHFGHVARDGLEDVARAIEVDGTGGGEADGARGAKEERIAEDLFKLADLLGERRLRKMQAQGGAAEVELFGDGNEVAEVTKLDAEIHT